MAIKVTAKDNDVVAGAAIRVDQRTVSLTEDDDDDGSAMVMVRLAVEPTGDVTVAEKGKLQIDLAIAAHRQMRAASRTCPRPVRRAGATPSKKGVVAT